MKGQPFPKKGKVTLNMHIAQIGTGRVGRPTAYMIMEAKLPDTLTLCDTKPGLAAAFAEELKHANTSLKSDVKILSCEKDEQVTNADMILISAGEPRPSGIKISRRDLAVKNARIIKHISEATRHRNPNAKYIVITNPVDAMAMVCKKYTGAEYVVSTGTNLESLRFRSSLSETFHVPPSRVAGWVGGEHGDAAVTLWSTAKIKDLPVEEYSKSIGMSFDKSQIESYVKTVSKFIVDSIGGTEYGPATSFRDIVKAIIEDTHEMLSISSPIEFPEIKEPVFVGVPTRVGQTLDLSPYESLTENERDSLMEAAKIVFQTYLLATDCVKKQ